MILPCPQCGGEIHLQETTGFVGCAFCGTSLVLDLTGVRPHLLCRPRYGIAEILPLVRRWCATERLPPASQVSTPRLTFYPFWRYAVPGRPRLVAAWPALEPRWSEITFPEAEQVIFDPSAVGTAHVVEPEVAEAAARHRAFGEAAGSLAPGDLLHVPFYEVEGLLAGHKTRLCLDACSGRVYPDRIPTAGAASGGRHGFGLAMAILVFLGMIVEAVLIPPVWLAALVVGLTALGLYWALVGDRGRSPR